MSVDALDQSWARVDPAKAQAAGIGLVSGYLSHDPSKNWTADWVRAYHAHGIGVLLNWESNPGRPLLGAAAGNIDAHDALAQAQALIRQVGYQPAYPLGIVFSCDRDVTSDQWPMIEAYYLAAKRQLSPAGFLTGVYGEHDLVEHLHAEGITEVEWQTLAWSGGRISAEADLYQSSINNILAGSSVDFDQVRHPAELGAWWPPGSATEAAATGGARPISSSTSTSHPQEEEPDMLIIFPVGQPGRPASFDGCKATRITSGTTINSLRAAGIKTAAVAAVDYSAFIAAGNR